LWWKARQAAETLYAWSKVAESSAIASEEDQSTTQNPMADCKRKRAKPMAQVKKFADGTNVRSEMCRKALFERIRALVRW
jgi:hypothetical protein